MANFFPDQRWTSEGEPELGIGIVTDTSKGRVQIHFPASGETRLYAADSAPLRRISFKPGDTIVDSQNRPLIVERVQDQGELILYIGKDRAISEADLGEVTVQHGVDDRLFNGDVDEPALFALRRQTLELDHQRRISAVQGFVGGRIDLIPHQLYIAHEVSSRFAPRVLLSDEVGLGKTIEACLILHRLLQNGRISRVLILVPDSLVHQWFVELLRKFNLWFHIFDEARCEALEETAPEGNPFLDDQLILCSTSFLAGSEKRARQALSASWDMLVVDEAHHLSWSPEAASPEYSIVELLSQAAQGLLLLTATPEQLGEESHFARLRLLDPDRYSDFASYQEEARDHQQIAEIVDKLLAHNDLSKNDKQLLNKLLGKEWPTQVDTERQDLIGELLDQHGPGRVIFRNTRAAMTNFPGRKARLTPIREEEHPELWQERMVAEFEVDSGKSKAPSRRSQFWFDKDPRVLWLVKLLDKLEPAKVLLICRTKEKVLALEQAVSQRFSGKVGVFHEDLNIVQRDRNAAWFAEKDGAQLLICSEIGSEGRNFQFAHHLVLFDMPLHPELLEQRIGRLDRIGQTKDIQIHVPYLVGSQQEVMVRWYHEGMNAFEQNLEGASSIMAQFDNRLKTVLGTVGTEQASSQLSSLIVDTAVFHQELRERLAKGRDRLLEMNSFRPAVARELVKGIRQEDKNPTLESYLTGVFELFSVEMEDLAPRTLLLHAPTHHAGAFPAIPEEGISITFDRKRALSREDISFVTWDHPMATGVIDMVLSQGVGSAGFGVLRDGSPGILLEALFVLETSGARQLHVDRFLPNTPLRVVVDHAGRDVTEEYPADWLNHRLIPGRMDDLLDNEVLVETILPNMISTATEQAESMALRHISAGLRKMNETLGHEIDRLESLRKNNDHIRPEEIQLARNEQATLAEKIREAGIRLDGLMVIQKGG